MSSGRARVGPRAPPLAEQPEPPSGVWAISPRDRWLEELELTDDVRPLILKDNAVRMFGLG